MKEHNNKEGGLWLDNNYKSSEKNLLVSIITVVYNGEKYIEQTINSVLNQSYKNIEYIIIDGNSNDKTLDILKKYEDRLDYWISSDDDGIYDAMNKGIRLSRGEVIGIINSDDWYSKESINTVVHEFQKDKELNLVHGAMAKCNEAGKIVKIVHERKSQFSFLEKPPFNHPTVFVKRTVYKKIGNFNLSYKTASDYDFMLKVLKDKSIKIKYIDIVITNFRLVGVTSNNWLPPIKQLYKLLEENKFSYIKIFLGILYRILRNMISKILK